MKNLISAIALTLISVVISSTALAADPEYFTAFEHMKMSRNNQGVLLVQMHDGNGGAIDFKAKDHTQFTEAYYRIGRDRDNKIVIITGVKDWMPSVDFSSFGNIADPNIWGHIHDEGVQILENIANIRVPLIAAIEGKAWVHTEHALLANVIVAGESATFRDLPHFGGGIVPGDGIFTTWSYRAGPGRAEAFLLNLDVISAQTAYDWGVVSEVVEDGQAVTRAFEIAEQYLKQPELARRNTRIHFIQPLKERVVREVGYGLNLEGSSAAAKIQLMKQNASQK